MFRDLINLLESIVLTEGGNIWKDELSTKRIDRKDVEPTIKFLEKITGLPLVQNMLGSTGLKPTSGDLDLAVDNKKYNKVDLQNKLDAWAKTNDNTALTKKTGVSVHFRTPINGDSKNGYVQTDFMFLDDLPFAKWSMSAPESMFKGAHKHILLASIAKPLGMKWSFQTGLTNRETGEPVKGGKNPDDVAKILFGPNANSKTISTVENILSALENDPNKEKKLADAKTVIGKELEDYERNKNLTEEDEQTSDKKLTKQHLESVLKQNGYEDLKVKGSNIIALVQIPEGKKASEFRMAVMNEILGILQAELNEYGPQYSDDTSLSSLGGLIFANSNLKVLVKDSGKQGEKSAGIGNEIEIASMIESVIQKYGSANVSFTDPRGVKLTIENATNVEVAGRSTTGRRKADVVITSPNSRLPISIKKLNAEAWESADSMIGKRAREIIDKLVDEGIVELIPIGTRKDKVVYKLSREIVMEPTEEEAMQAIFGSDINPEGGIVIQTFKPEHFKQNENNVDVDAHAVIVKKDDIPESHVMVWLLRNDSTRNNEALGYAGIRPLGVTLQRGLGKKGTKDVVYVDSEGNVIKSAVAPKSKEKSEEPKKDWLEKQKKQEFDPGREKRKY